MTYNALKPTLLAATALVALTLGTLVTATPALADEAGPPNVASKTVTAVGRRAVAPTIQGALGNYVGKNAAAKIGQLVGGGATGFGLGVFFSPTELGNSDFIPSMPNLASIPDMHLHSTFGGGGGGPGFWSSRIPGEWGTLTLEHAN